MHRVGPDLRLRPREGRAGLPSRPHPVVGRRPLRPRQDGLLLHRRILPAAPRLHQVGESEAINDITL